MGLVFAIIYCLIKLMAISGFWPLLSLCMNWSSRQEFHVSTTIFATCASSCTAFSANKYFYADSESEKVAWLSLVDFYAQSWFAMMHDSQLREHCDSMLN